ncbi:hypothetical protein glysoja_021866 [Glycine soja]|nr:hypothetical protein glysoja_021866 [Glycine soja]
MRRTSFLNHLLLTVVTDLVTTVALVALRPSDRKRRRKGIETERPKSVATVAYEVFRQ